MSNEAASCYFDINVFTDRYGWATLWLAHKDMPQVYMGEWVKIRCIYKTQILNTYDWLIWIVFFHCFSEHYEFDPKTLSF